MYCYNHTVNFHSNALVHFFLNNTSLRACDFVLRLSVILSNYAFPFINISYLCFFLAFLKVYHIGRHLPSWFRGMAPKTALEVHEESWNAYPYTKTKFSVPFVDKFTLEVDTVFQPDAGTQVRNWWYQYRAHNKRMYWCKSYDLTCLEAEGHNMVFIQQQCSGGSKYI